MIEILVASTKRYGAEAWLSVRVNDHHFADDPGLNSILSYSRADEVGVDSSIEFLTVSGFYIPTYYSIPADRWRTLIDQRT